MIEGYLTINEVAKKWNVSARRVRAMCSNGQIVGATKIGKIWAIPVSSEKPLDGRITSGKYKNWRNTKNSKSV